MKSFLVPMYWLWCGASVFILVRRRIKKGDGAAAEQSNDPTTIASTPIGGSVPPAPLTDPVGITAPVVAAPPPTMTMEPDGAVLSAALPPSRVGSLAEALEGIRLPETLAPLVGDGDFDPGSLVLFSRDTPAEVVGTAMADELERLGFRVTPLDEQRVLATSADATLQATVHPDSAVRDEMGVPRFPTAPADSVVLEMRLR
jgi:hypothetical protein